MQQNWGQAILLHPLQTDKVALNMNCEDYCAYWTWIRTIPNRLCYSKKIQRRIPQMSNNPVVLITGAAHRIGATTAKLLHQNGMNIVLHYRGSREAAQAVQKELNEQRENSVILIQADLHITNGLSALIEESVKAWGRLDVLINNASSFYPTHIGKATEEQWMILLALTSKHLSFCRKLLLHI